MKIHLSFALLILAFVSNPALADSSSSSAEKEQINASIDRRLGWLDEPPVMPDQKIIESASTRLPNRFAWQSDRFMQSGPPPYAQQPENVDAISVASAILSGETSGLSRSQQAEALDSVFSNPAIQSAFSDSSNGTSFISYHGASLTISNGGSGSGVVIFDSGTISGGGILSGGGTISGGGILSGGGTNPGGGITLVNPGNVTLPGNLFNLGGNLIFPGGSGIITIYYAN